MKKVVVFLLSLCSYSVFSQDSLKVITLESFSISAVRATHHAPIPQTNLSLEQIEAQYVGQHPIFLLETVSPSIVSSSQAGTAFGNYGSIRLRGMSQDRINFTLNGVPLNDMIDQGVFFSNFADIAFNFESIQVQRGVGVSTNGVSSYAGSINFESINLSNKKAFTRLETGLGSFGTLRGNIQHFSGISPKGFGFLSSFSKVNSNGFKENTFSDALSYFLTGGYYGNKDVVKLTLFIAQSKNGLGYSAIDESILKRNLRFNNLSKNDRDDFRQFLAQVNYSKTITSQLTVGATSYYGGAKGDFISYGKNSPLKNEHLGTIVNVDYKQKAWAVQAGFHGYRFNRTNKESDAATPATPFYKEQSVKEEISAFLKATYSFKKVKFFGDIQARNTELKIEPDYSAVGIQPEGNLQYQWNFVNPRIGVTYLLTDQIEPYFSFGRSGREPTKVDLFRGFRLDSTNYSAVKSGDLVKSETVNDWELGVRYNTQHISVDFNAFWMNFENEIAPNGSVLEFGVGEKRNIPQSRRSGLELAVDYLISNKVKMSSTASYSNSEVKNLQGQLRRSENSVHILTPKWNINVAIAYQINENLKVEIRTKYISTQHMTLPNNPVFMVPSSFVTNGQVEMSLTKSIVLSAFVKNIFNAEDYTLGFPTDVNNDGKLERGFFVQPPRNFYLKLAIRLD
ncbi:TonB-dependent receptor [uncultured Roseivirga sp.]|uniref:TonB-dependent receptor n=1 Tax=uncultured Roseivirga sp. TaxID=543088 RepID=UPI000D79BF6D|nr:TonB-dependent receptor [uncultured Roseivirga sp.]PWL31912.1 MAG: hypothetical protein DCO95_01630 [Roseivirga sp. XM-24bin3]